MTFIDWFAGVGGFRKGMEDAGHTCVGFCEYDKFAVMSYTAMHLASPEQLERLAKMPMKERQVEILKEEYRSGEWYADDIRRVDAGDIPRADCWCFGAPCQDFSNAYTARRGLDGDRSSLVREIFRLVREMREEDRPEWLIYENVKGMLSSNRGFDFLAILFELDECGYDIEWQILNSKDFGVPQNRERVYTVGHFRRYGERKVFPLAELCEADGTDEGHGVLHTNTIQGVNKLSRGVYVIDRQTDRQTDRQIYPHRQGKRISSVRQIGNIMPTRTRANPNQGRVYDPRGLAPCLTNLSGGGGRMPWIIC